MGFKDFWCMLLSTIGLAANSALLVVLYENQNALTLYYSCAAVLVWAWLVTEVPAHRESVLLPRALIVIQSVVLAAVLASNMTDYSTKYDQWMGNVRSHERAVKEIMWKATSITGKGL